jgi:hypothetical protein
VRETSQSLGGAPKLIIGSKPIDGGYYILNDEERGTLIKASPQSERFIRPFIGAEEYLNGKSRWILALQSASPTELRVMPSVLDIITSVSAFRRGEIPRRKDRHDISKLKEPGISSRALADTPTEWHVTVLPDRPFLAIPEVSSERREYVPFGWLEPPTIPSNLVRIMMDANLYDFAILTSAMHMAWLRNVGGRLKSDYRYSIGLVYNTFPWPEANEAQKESLRGLAQAVLDAREEFPDSSLADLYDPLTMPASLRRAHRALDAAVDRLYRKAPFTSDRERAEHLFGLYEKLSAPLEAAAKAKPKRRRTNRRTLPS